MIRKRTRSILNRRFTPSRVSSPAFTLVELMVSIAIVVILILGVQFMFKTAADAAGAGHALGTATRTHRQLNATLTGDFANAAFDDGPCVVIRMEREWAFRNEPDQLSDRDWGNGGSFLPSQIRTVDLNENNS